MNRKIFVCILTFMAGHLYLAGQYYNTGQDPASLKWREIKSGHFHFIYPESYESEASQTALIFENSYELLKGRYNEKEIKNFPVIIHNYAVESNGYVAWAPKRVELFPYPGQNSIPMLHTEQLALHELVHVTQMQGLRQNLSRPVEWLLGEQYTGALSIFTPFWFLEGDAVYSETIYSDAGRGRQASFRKKLKALLLEKGESYSYDKMINGSYKSYVPDHYQSGYQLTSFVNDNFGHAVFSNALAGISASPFSLNPFNISLKRDIGMSKKQLFDTTMTSIGKSWKEQEVKSAYTAYPSFNPDKKGRYISYSSPVRAGKDSIIAVRSSLYNPPEIVLLSKGGMLVEKLFTPGYMWPYRISYAAGKLVWAEQRNDPRWDNRAYSVLRILDLESGLCKTLSRKSRYFSPSLSPEGKLIVASETNPSNTNSLLIIDSRNGKLIQRINIPGNSLAVNPVWSEKGDKIVFISSNGKGEGIMSLSYPNLIWDNMLSPGRDDLQSLSLWNDTIYFVSSSGGTDNVFALAQAGNITKLSSSRFGVSDVSVSEGQITFSDYSSSGNKLVCLNLKELPPLPVKTATDRSAKFTLPDSLNKLSYNLDNLNDSRFVSRPYKKWKNLFRFHSWMPFYTDINNISFDNLDINPGFTIMSQNYLSTLTSSIAYEYSEQEHILHSSIILESFYPVIEFDLQYGGQPLIIQDNDNLYYPSVVYPSFRSSANIYIPLHFNSGRYNQTVWPSLGFSYENNYIFEEGTSVFDYGQTRFSTRLYFSNLHRLSHRDIWPRWGQVIDLYASFSPAEKEIYGPGKSIRTALYFPGLLPNNAIRVRLQAEQQSFRRLLQYNRISFPRGYNNIISAELLSFSTDYAIPLYYPDINAGSIFYLKRLRANLFYDYSQGKENYYVMQRELVSDKQIFSSFGTELLADFHLLRLPFSFTGGVQAAWLPYNNEPYFKLLFNIDVFGYVIGKGRPAY